MPLADLIRADAHVDVVVTTAPAAVKEAPGLRHIDLKSVSTPAQHHELLEELACEFGTVVIDWSWSVEVGRTLHTQLADDVGALEAAGVDVLQAFVCEPDDQADVAVPISDWLGVRQLVQSAQWLGRLARPELCLSYPAETPLPRRSQVLAEDRLPLVLELPSPGSNPAPALQAMQQAGRIELFSLADVPTGVLAELLARADVVVADAARGFLDETVLRALEAGTVVIAKGLSGINVPVLPLVALDDRPVEENLADVLGDPEGHRALAASAPTVLRAWREGAVPWILTVSDERSEG